MSNSARTNRARKRDAKALQRVNDQLSYTQALRVVDGDRASLPNARMSTSRRDKAGWWEVLKRVTSCAHPDCTVPDAHLHSADIGANALQVAHIWSPCSSGPRHHPSLPVKLCHREENLLALCSAHHALIDRYPDQYTANKLFLWKQLQVAQAESADRSSNLVRETQQRAGRLNRASTGKSSHEIE